MSKKEKDSSYINRVTKKLPKKCEYAVSLVTDRDRAKVIKQIEREARGMMEYGDYIKFLKDNVGLDSCIFFSKVTSKNTKHVSLEMHHEPLTLYDIAEVVLTKFIEEGEEINTLLIAAEVVEAHYANLVGLVPLSKTCHEMIHNSDKLYVPLTMVYGNYREFLEKYDAYISQPKYEDLYDRLYDKIDRAIERTENLTPESFDALVKEFTYIDIEGVEDQEKMPLTDDVTSAA